MMTAPIDLRARARQAMLDAGFHPDFPPEVSREIQQASQAQYPGPAIRDLRSLLWSSIDNDESRDLDQIEFVEKLSDGAVRLLVGIADVDSSRSEEHTSELQSPYDLVCRLPLSSTPLPYTTLFRSPEVSREIQQASQAQYPGPAIRDLRSLLWSSIDNDESRDLDQIEFVEKLSDGAVRLLVGIADVDSSVGKGSATDQHAASESTSVYTGVTTFPMLPGELSTDRTSLVQAQERLCLVIELHVLNSGEVDSQDLYLAVVRNQAKLAYSSTGAWLEGRGPMPPAIATTPGMESQLRLQEETCEKLRTIRKQHGALTFGSIEARPVMANGEVKDLTLTHHNIAQDIIESFMVAANVAMAQYLREKGSLSLRRVVRTPRRWDRIQAIAAQFGFRLPAMPDPRALSQFLEQRKAA